MSVNRFRTMGRVSAAGARGFTLIEVLVAIVIFSIGMLGLLGLTSNGLLMTYTANYTTTGAQLAYAMADSARVNLPQLASYDDPGYTYEEGCFTATGCGEEEIVYTGFKQWSDMVANTLPAGEGHICRDASPSDGNPDDWECDAAATAPFTVKVCWSNQTGGGGWSCYRVVI